MMTSLTRLLVLFSTAWLVGCAGPRAIESTVQSFTQWPAGAPGAGATYRFERLPSQASGTAGAAHQDQLEALARAALAKVGFEHQATGAYIVQVQAGLVRIGGGQHPYPPMWIPGRDYVINARGQIIWTGMSPMWIPEPEYFRREVALVIRAAATGGIVYESRAHNEGPYALSATALTAMLDAALSGFPQPPSGPRTVQVVLPEPGMKP